MDLGNGQIVLEEDYDENYEPTEKEILDYCTILGLDPDTERDLMYIAKEGTKAPLPPDWKPIEDRNTGGIYYFNFKTNKSTWDHPCDEFYRKLLTEERRKKSKMAGSVGSKKGSKKLKSSVAGKAQLGPLNPLNPIASVGAGVGPLGPLKGLPPLKLGPLKPGALAPVRPSPGMVPTPHTDTSSIITSQPPNLKGKGMANEERKRSNLLGTVELGKDINISTQFEEEEEEDESSSGISEGFQSKVLGHNILNSTDIGLKSEEEELHSSEEGNTSEELMKLLISDKEEEVDEGDDEEMMRPSAPLGRPDHTGFSPTGPTDAPLLSPPIPSSLSPLPTTHGTIRSLDTLSTVNAKGIHSNSAITTPNNSNLLTTSAAPINKESPNTNSLITTTYDRGLVTTTNVIMATSTRSTTNTTVRGLPITVAATDNSKRLPFTTSSSITPPPGMKASSFQNTSQSTASNIATTSHYTPPGISSGFTVAEITAGGSNQVVGGTSSVNIEEKNKQELEKMKLEHEQALEELRKQLSTELEQEKENIKREGREEMERVRREGREELEKVRRKVEEEKAEEERQLRDRKLKNISELMKTLKEEEEEDEARLVEEKEDSVRRLRQKVSAEREKEEGKLREDAEQSHHKLFEKLAAEKHKEETKLRSEASQEVSKLRAEVARKTEEEKEEVKRELQRQLQVFKEEQEDKHNKEKAEIEESSREQLEELRREEQQKVQLEFERKQAIEEEREKAVQANQQAIAALEQELAIELESKRSELQEQHQTVLETIKREFEATLVSVKTEYTDKVEQERQRLENEYSTISTTLKEEQKSRVEQLKRELTMYEEQCKQQVELQSERLAAMQAEYDVKYSELQQQQKQLEQQLLQVENERRLNTLGSTDGHREGLQGDGDNYRGRGGRRQERDNPLISVVTEASCAAVQAGDSSMPPSPSLTRPPLHTHIHKKVPGTERVNISGDEGVKMKDKRKGINTRSHDSRSEEDWSETSGTVGSMQVEELTPPVPTHNTPDNLESVRAMLEQNQRTLLRILASEQSQAVLDSRNTRESGDIVESSDGGDRVGRRRRSGSSRMGEKTNERKKRDGVSKKNVREDRRMRGKGSEDNGQETRVQSKKRRSRQSPKSVDGGDTLMTSSSKLQEGVKALNDLEEKLKTSRQLLLSREKDLRDLHSQLTGDPSSDDEGATRVRVNEPIVAGHTTLSDREHVRTPVQVSRTASNIRTPRDGIRRNEERDFRTGPSRTHNKEPSHSTPSSTRSVGRNKTSHDARNEEKESGRGNREPSSSRVLHLEMSGSEEVSTNASGDEYPTPTEDTSVIEEDQRESQQEIAMSLNSINRQLSQLMSQFNQGPPRPDHSIHSLDVTGSSRHTHNPLPYYATLPPPTTLRWAEPVVHTGITVPCYHHHHQPHSERRPTESTGTHHIQSTPKRQHSRSGESHVTTSPTYPYPTMNGSYRNPEMLRQHQMNWLQEFQHHFPGPPVPAPPLARPPSTPLVPYTVPHAQLVMDRDKNIHLVHM